MLLKQIELFVTVAKHQNLGRAAQYMHISASSVCQRLKSLENELGVRLYQRNKEGIELTGPGRTLLATANQVMDKLNGVKETLSRDLKQAAKSLTIGGTYNPATKYLPGAIAVFQKSHPNVKLSFITGDRVYIQKLLRRSEIDIAMIQTPSKSFDFILERYATDNLMLFAHPAHPLTRKKTLDLHDFERTPLIVRAGRGTSEKMLKQLQSRGMVQNVNIVLRCTSPNAVKAAVRKKMGVGILFFNQIERDVARKDLTLLNFVGLPKLVGSSYIVYCKNRPLSRAASEFLDFLRSMKLPAENRPANSKANENSALSA